jgi:1,6-anhydro-N-acetylmuramate kinase
MEAELFAFLATRSLLGMPTSYPNITGVSNPVTCGELHVA